MFRNEVWIRTTDGQKHLLSCINLKYTEPSSFHGQSELPRIKRRFIFHVCLCVLLWPVLQMRETYKHGDRTMTIFCYARKSAVNSALEVTFLRNFCYFAWLRFICIMFVGRLRTVLLKCGRYVDLPRTWNRTNGVVFAKTLCWISVTHHHHLYL